MRAEIDSLGKDKTVFYKYWVGQKSYESKQTVAIERMSDYDFYETNIFYNEQLSFLSYVGKKELIIISPVCGMTILGIIFLFFWGGIQMCRYK